MKHLYRSQKEQWKAHYQGLEQSKYDQGSFAAQGSWTKKKAVSATGNHTLLAVS